MSSPTREVDQFNFAGQTHGSASSVDAMSRTATGADTDLVRLSCELVDAALEEPAEPRHVVDTRTRSSFDATALSLLTCRRGEVPRALRLLCAVGPIPGRDVARTLTRVSSARPLRWERGFGGSIRRPHGHVAHPLAHSHAMLVDRSDESAYPGPGATTPGAPRRRPHTTAPLIGKSRWRLERNFEFVVDGLAKACLQSATYQAGPPDPRWAGGHRLGEKNETANSWCSCRRDGVCVGTCCDHPPCRFLHRR